MAEICVLRLGHRKGRDQRVTTHVFLAARALGASEGALCGDRDDGVIEGMQRVSRLWGGSFPMQYVENWKRFLLEKKKAGWKIAHLTMYGTDFEAGARALQDEKVVVVVGAGRVPKDAYGIADFNLAVANQPHSEISALALFLDRLCFGGWKRTVMEGELRISPNKCGKVVLRGRNR